MHWKSDNKSACIYYVGDKQSDINKRTVAGEVTPVPAEVGEWYHNLRPRVRRGDREVRLERSEETVLIVVL